MVPGQGAFGACAAALDAGGGALRQAIGGFLGSGRPFFGICIGMQLLFERSDENPGRARLRRAAGAGPPVRRPAGVEDPAHGVERDATRSAAGAGVADGAFFYFVHSYYPDPERPDDVALTSDHGAPFCAAVRHGNVFGTQFHPEKSQAAGLTLLRGFASA